MTTLQRVAIGWVGAGMLGVALAGTVQADHHGDKQDIVDTAVAAGQFETLAAALEAAGLVETLKGEGPFTVFAPTDEAFGKLPEGTVESLLEPENREQLQAVLTYHVVPGKVMAADAMNLDSATTVQGQDLTITTMNGSVMIDDANVIQADIEASNGVIHVIDSVLMPE
ncbi:MULTISPECIES: fasciclin domain-containing protein [unclassified Halomonas]|nr:MULTISPECIES: fasciclin domain-containing protein [Halomonas]QPP50777.1 fasciclin domain-containing protein [Halomonas sp. SS10-MC5]